MRAVLGALLAVITFSSQSLANGIDPLNNFCRRWYHQSQVKDGTLFIDGGLESFEDESVPGENGQQPGWTGPITTGSNNYVIAIDMRTSWDWKTNISEVAINNTGLLGISPQGNPVPRVQSAALFQGAPGDKQIYLYGGVTPTINTTFPHWQWPTTNQYTLWGFDTQTHNWMQYDIFSSVPQRPSWGAYAEAQDQGLAFYFNGMITNESSPSTATLGAPQFLGGMVVLDLNNKTATNRSTDVITAGSPRVRGQMIYIPFVSSKGVLITIGGATGTTSNLNLVSMNEVNIFDLTSLSNPDSITTSNGWYTQSITGSVPDPRVDFCIVLATAPDKSSFNIYMYGGWDPTQKNKYFDEVWVLSIPSFTWVQIYTGTSPRFGHTCHAVGNRQMVTVGGLDSINTTDYCDWEFKSVAIYDLTEGELAGWGSVFMADKPPYQVNAQISAVIGGGLDGNATKLLPDGGWSSTLVANLFTGTNNQTAPFVLPDSSSLSPAAPSSNRTRKAVIAGASVAAVVGFAGLCILAFFIRRRWRSWFPQQVMDDGQKPFAKPELDGVEKGLNSIGTGLSGATEVDSHVITPVHSHVISPVSPSSAQVISPIETHNSHIGEHNDDTRLPELPPPIHETHTEAGGNSRSEIAGKQMPAETGGVQVYEKDHSGEIYEKDHSGEIHEKEG